MPCLLRHTEIFSGKNLMTWQLCQIFKGVLKLKQLTEFVFQTLRRRMPVWETHFCGKSHIEFTYWFTYKDEKVTLNSYHFVTILWAPSAKGKETSWEGFHSFSLGHFAPQQQVSVPGFLFIYLFINYYYYDYYYYFFFLPYHI